MIVKALTIGLPKRETFGKQELVTGICNQLAAGAVFLSKLGFEGDGVRVVVNALLAGFWAGNAALQVSGEVNEAALWAAGTAALRAVIGYVADKLG